MRIMAEGCIGKRGFGCVRWAMAAFEGWGRSLAGGGRFRRLYKKSAITEGIDGHFAVMAASHYKHNGTCK